MNASASATATAMGEGLAVVMRTAGSATAAAMMPVSTARLSEWSVSRLRHSL